MKKIHQKRFLFCFSRTFSMIHFGKLAEIAQKFGKIGKIKLTKFVFNPLVLTQWNFPEPKNRIRLTDPSPLQITLYLR